MDSLIHLQEAEVAVMQVRGILPEARVFPDMAKLATGAYVCIHSESLVMLILMAGAGKVAA
jgi:hypothetical protein